LIARIVNDQFDVVVDQFDAGEATLNPGGAMDPELAPRDLVFFFSLTETGRAAALAGLVADKAIGGHAEPGGYVAVQAYLQPSRIGAQRLRAIAGTIAEATGAAVTIGYGPRFLHSTGQFHKGGPDGGVFLQIVDDPEDDLAEASLANALHKLGEDDAAIVHHQRAIELDPEYAPHYYNYANTLYEIGDKAGALDNYKKAIEFDGNLQSANDMIKKLEERE